MDEPESRASDDSGRFRTAHWILLFARSQVPGSRTALANVCRLRWDPQALHERVLGVAFVASEGRP